MFSSLRSAALPLLFTVGLSVIMVLGVQDLARHSRATCDRPLLAAASATRAQPAAETPIGGIHLSRFDRSGAFGCQGMRVALPAAVRQ
jgi:hypothetical protein